MKIMITALLPILAMSTFQQCDNTINNKAVEFNSTTSQTMKVDCHQLNWDGIKYYDTFLVTHDSTLLDSSLISFRSAYTCDSTFLFPIMNQAIIRTQLGDTSAAKLLCTEMMQKSSKDIGRSLETVMFVENLGYSDIASTSYLRLHKELRDSISLLAFDFNRCQLFIMTTTILADSSRGVEVADSLANVYSNFDARAIQLRELTGMIQLISSKGYLKNQNNKYDLIGRQDDSGATK